MATFHCKRCDMSIGHIIRDKPSATNAVVCRCPDCYHLKTQRPFTCKVCGENFQKRSLLYLHEGCHKAVPRKTKSLPTKTSPIKEPSPKGKKKNYACPFDLERFHERIDLKLHLMRDHNYNPDESQNKLGYCGFCHKEFKNKVILKKHTKRLHPELFKCAMCGKAFEKMMSLRRHEENHTEDKTRTGKENQPPPPSPELKLLLEDDSDNASFGLEAFTNMQNPFTESEMQK